jgi:hypothetical protein
MGLPGPKGWREDTRMRVLAMLGMLLFGSPAFAQELLPPLEGVRVEAPPEVPEGWDTQPGINVVVHAPADESKIALYLANRASAEVPKLAERLGVPIGGQIHLYVASTDAEFHDIQPGRTPEWADGTAWPESGAVFLRAPRARLDATRPLETVMKHEIVHVLLGRAFMPNHPPRWLQEGLAQVYAGEDDLTSSQALSRGLSERGKPYGLDQLNAGFPRSAEGAQLAYAESADFISYVREKHGEKALRKLIAALAQGKGIDSALYIATGDTLEEVDKAWTASLERRWSSWEWAVGPQIVGAGLGILAVAALITARRRTRRRMQAMKDAEAARELAFREWLDRPVTHPDVDTDHYRWSVPGIH